MKICDLILIIGLFACVLGFWASVLDLYNYVVKKESEESVSENIKMLIFSALYIFFIGGAFISSYLM